jgi:hypothetical protein
MIIDTIRQRLTYRGVEGMDGAILRLVRALPSQRVRGLERWLRGREEARRLRVADCVLASSGKSGRTWLRAMLAHYYEHEYGLATVGMLDFDNLHRQDPRVPTVLFTHGNYVRHFTRHYDSKVDFYGKKVILLARDPRDTAVSLYFQWKYRMSDYKKRINRFPEGRAEISIFEFVMSEHGIPRIVTFLNEWASEVPRLRHLCLVRYEDMSKDASRVLGRVLDFLGTRGTRERIQAAVEFARFDNLQKLEGEKVFAHAGGALKPGDVRNPDSYKVRRGKVGGYRDYFDAAQLRAIDDLTRATLSPFYDYATEP